MSRRPLPDWPPLRDARGRLISCLPLEEPPAQPLRPLPVFLGGATLALCFYLLLLLAA